MASRIKASTAAINKRRRGTGREGTLLLVLDLLRLGKGREGALLREGGKRATRSWWSYPTEPWSREDDKCLWSLH
jgi:hypothetical protein